MQGFETAEYSKLMNEVSGSKQLLLIQRKKLKQRDLHIYTSKPIKASHSEGIDLLLSTLFIDNSVGPS